MDGFTIIDGLVALIVVISAILAYSRGLVREVMSILGWIAAAIAAFLLAPTVEPLVGEIPFVGDFLGESCELSIIAAFALVFAVALVIVSVFTPLFSSVVQGSPLGPIDRGLGFLFGVARGALLVAVAFLVYERAVTANAVAAVENSRSAALFARTEARLEASVPEDAPGWIVMRYEELVGPCGA